MMNYAKKLNRILWMGESFAKDGGDFREVLAEAFGDRIYCDGKYLIATDSKGAKFAVWRHKKGCLVASIIVNETEFKADEPVAEHLSSQIEAILKESM